MNLIDKMAEMFNKMRSDPAEWSEPADDWELVRSPKSKEPEAVSRQQDPADRSKIPNFIVNQGLFSTDSGSTYRVTDGKVTRSDSKGNQKVVDVDYVRYTAGKDPSGKDRCI